MTTLYWILEYAKVLFAYLFILYVWPMVVFDKKLKGKSLTFKFGFCSVAMPTFISTIVLVLGLFHLLYQWIVFVIFYAIFLVKMFYYVKGRHNYVEALRRIVTGTYGAKNFCIKVWKLFLKSVKQNARRFRDSLGSHIIEYLILSVILIFGVIYFSYGAFQSNSYGFGDCYTHNSWIYGLQNGQIFSAGVYPEGMHCIVYAISTLFGIRVYSVMLFLQGIHSSLFLLAAYIMLKEVFRFKYTPHIVLTLFLTVDLVCIDMVYGMSRLQWTIPQEFALYTPFLCVAFLVRYIKSGKEIIIPEGEKKTIILRALKGLLEDDNMLVFSLAVATSLIVHFYTTIMAVFLCIAFVPVIATKLFRPKNLVPLMVMAIIGFFIAVVPMAGALASGIPFQGSIGWAVSVIQEGEDKTTALIADAEAGNVTDDSNVDTTSDQKNDNKGSSLTKLINGVYHSGYITLYGLERAKLIIALSVLGLILYVLMRLIVTLRKVRRRSENIDATIYDHYFSIILASMLMMLLYCAPDLGLPSLVAGSRLCTTVNVLVIAACVVPIDAFLSLFRGMAEELGDAVGILSVAAIYVAVQWLGIFHGYLYYELTRYNSAVITTKKITEAVPNKNFTIVSTVDELYQMIDYGFHEELIVFANECVKDEYTLPTEYVFIYVEKHPLKYAQFHFFDGPDWLAKEKYKGLYGPEYTSQGDSIIHSTASPELSRPPFELYPVSFKAYKDFFQRTVIQSRVKEWCREFGDLYPDEMHVFYEDDDFVCYYFRQNPSCLYQLAFQSAYEDNHAKGIWD